MIIHQIEVDHDEIVTVSSQRLDLIVGQIVHMIPLLLECRHYLRWNEKFYD